ncbi:MAG TPA: GMP/IMP nucleotidase [Rhodocyclaceae bacterium]|nr:GMP/IMP nucleotidase [Rhodocyclaceae bacterium]
MRPDWNKIETVLLDMDGTLLDLNFDNHFWQHHLPRRFAEQHGRDLEEVRAELRERFKAHEGTLPWYSVDFWTDELAIDLMTLKHEVAHLIEIHPGVTEFLTEARAADKRVLLVTNAHHKSLTLKMARTGLSPHFDAMITSHELGLPKEDVTFWDALRAVHPFDPATTLLVDDTISVLDSAHQYGIAELRAICRPDTCQPERGPTRYQALNSFHDLLPI